MVSEPGKWVNVSTVTSRFAYFGFPGLASAADDIGVV